MTQINFATHEYTAFCTSLLAETLERMVQRLDGLGRAA